MSDTTSCPLCGTPCRVVGNTTQHYEPVTDKNSTLGNVDGESCGNHSHGHPLHLCKPKMEPPVPAPSCNQKARADTLEAALREIEWRVEFCSVEDGCNGCLIHRIARAALESTDAAEGREGK